MNLASFPLLSIKPDDISGSYSEWLDEFELAIEIKSLEMGYEEVTVDSEVRKVSRFTEKARTLVLLKCIGSEGRRVLGSEGYTDLANCEEPMYRKILQTLHKHFGNTESKYVKTHRFVTVRQGAGEDYSGYLRRVETLSRTTGLFEHGTAAIHEVTQDIRSNLALVLAVNGLRDQTLCRELIAKPDLTWTSLGDILRSKATANDSVEKLHGDRKGEAKAEASANAIESRHRYEGRRPSSERNRYTSRDRDYRPHDQYMTQYYSRGSRSRREHSSDRDNRRSRDRSSSSGRWTRSPSRDRLSFHR